MGVNLNENNIGSAEAFESALHFHPKEDKDEKNDKYNGDLSKYSKLLGNPDITPGDIIPCGGDKFSPEDNYARKLVDINPVKTAKSGSEYERYVDKYIVPQYKPESKRPSKDEYYLNIAESVAKRGTCLRRKFGAVIVKNDVIISTGYVGAPRGRTNCHERGKCFRQEMGIAPGQRYELCRSVHAEMNAIVNASRDQMIGGTLYLVGIENDGTYTDADCCAMCKRVVINSGITMVVFRNKTSFRKVFVSEWVDNDDSLSLHEGY